MDILANMDTYDQNVWGCYVVANACFWCASLACHAVDTFCPGLEKTQGQKSHMTQRTFAHAAAVAFANIVICAAAVVPGGANLWRTLHAAPLGVGDAFHPPREALVLAGSLLVIDFWFYWTHRAMHHSSIYRAIHKMHHRFTAPTAVAAVYAHPVEFLVGNVGGVALGPILCNAHPYTAWAWFAVSLLSTCGSHSGYAALGADKHDEHHRLFDCNFGVGPFCDSLFKTRKEDIPKFANKPHPMDRFRPGKDGKRA